jgi:single-stranded DNA-binding protein
MAKQYSVMIPNVMADVHIAGRVTKDVEPNVTPNGANVANISIAVGRRYLPQGTTEWQEETAFFQLAVWGEAALRCRGIRKGDVIMASFSMADVKARPYGDGKASLEVSRAQVSKFAFESNGSNGAEAGMPPAVVAPEDEFAF